MDQTLNKSINKLLLRIATRAETYPPELLHQTFVEIEQIANGLQRVDHQIVYGRRGTGKTHAFQNLAVQLAEDGELPIYVDLRKIGSNNGLYADSGVGLPQRATQLLIDVIEAMHGELLSKAVEDDRFDNLLPCLDGIADAATQVKVEGPVSLEEEVENSTSNERVRNWGLTTGWGKNPNISLKRDSSKKASVARRDKAKVQRSGNELPRLLFGRLGNAVEECTKKIRPRRIWLLLDEWSSIPIELQPVLADMLRRTFFPCQGLTVKISSIERRSRFIMRSDAATYVGIELGSDTAAALNLDDHLLAAEGTGRAEVFFARLLSKHLSVLAATLDIPLNLDAMQFVRVAFSEGGFKEFVRASEGVPRDAINIVGLAAMAADHRAIRIEDIQSAAHKYYLQDKESGIKGNSEAEKLWDRLLRHVVADRKARTFLVRRNRDHTHPGLLDLYDARLIHLLRSGLTTPNRPGIDYDGYAVDYGSYVKHLVEANNEALWDARGKPWTFNGNGAVLPDRFDEGVIFNPATTSTLGKRRKP
jgi:hypothetical protein